MTDRSTEVQKEDMKTNLLFRRCGRFAAGAMLMVPLSTSLIGAESAAPIVRGEPIKPAKSELKGEPIKSTKPADAAKTAGTIATNAPAGDSTFVGFDKLSAFKYEVPEEDPNAPKNPAAPAAKDPDTQIPDTVKAFNNKRVSLKGFMLPLKVEAGLVTELLIMRDQSMCCYGTVPKINEWVSVKMTSKGVKPVMDQPITLTGKLKVGAIRENGYLVGIYQMDGEKMEGPAL
jgi:hypothetical protein